MPSTCPYPAVIPRACSARCPDTRRADLDRTDPELLQIVQRLLEWFVTEQDCEDADTHGILRWLQARAPGFRPDSTLAPLHQRTTASGPSPSEHVQAVHFASCIPAVRCALCIVHHTRQTATHLFVS